jgi:hypothetical protein
VKLHRSVDRDMDHEGFSDVEPRSNAPKCSSVQLTVASVLATSSTVCAEWLGLTRRSYLIISYQTELMLLFGQIRWSSGRRCPWPHTILKVLHSYKTQIGCRCSTFIAAQKQCSMFMLFQVYGLPPYLPPPLPSTCWLRICCNNEVYCAIDLLQLLCCFTDAGPLP